MASVIEVSQAVVERIAFALPDWESFWFEPSPIPVPAYCVRPDPKGYADYQQVHGLYTKWAFRIGFFTSGVDKEAARLLLGTVTDPKGPVIQALVSEDIRDRLWQCARGDVTVTDGRGWDMIRRNRVRGGYLYADIGAVVGAN